MSTHLAIGRMMRIYASARQCMRLDTSLLPATPTEAREVTQLWFLLEGTVHISVGSRTTKLDKPCLFRLPEHFSKGADGERSVRLVTGGARFRSVQFYHRAPASGFEIVPLSPRVLDRAAQYHASVIDTGDSSESSGAQAAFVDVLEAEGLVPRGLSEDALPRPQDASVLRVWSALRASYTKSDASPSIKLMAAAANLSRRHTTRLVAEISRDFLVPPGAFQEMVLLLRLTFASLLLSDPELSIAEVARLVGYAHPEGLANAHRRAGLPTPEQVRGLYLASQASMP
ncbi:MAG: AraC family transcriptional regulator [Polyangiaceae bacterium]